MIKLFGSTSKRRGVYFCDYHPILDNAINNFVAVKTARVFKGKCYIMDISFGYFTEILAREHIPFTVITTLAL